MYTEFISSEGLIRDAVKSTKKPDIFNFERPIGIQILEGNEDSMQKSSRDSFRCKTRYYRYKLWMPC